MSVDSQKMLPSLFRRRSPDTVRALQLHAGAILESMRGSFSSFADALTSAVSRHDLSLANSLAQARFPIGCKFEFCFGDDEITQAEHHFRWTASSSLHQVTLNRSFLSCGPGLQPTIGNRIASVLPLIATYDVKRFGDGSTIVDLGDWSAGVGLSFCDNRSDALLVPDSSFLASDGYGPARAAFQHAPPWHARRPSAIWRGSSTGEPTASFMALPRIRLCELAREHPDYIDAGITDVVQASTPEDAILLRESGLCKEFVSIAKHAEFKYQIDIDGNTNSWPGLFQKLLSGSPVMKVSSPNKYKQWYYQYLIPWHNFVPIRSDLSDLVSVIRFLQENDSLAEIIGAEGRELALKMTIVEELTTCQTTIRAAFDRSLFQSAFNAGTLLRSNKVAG